MQLGRVIGRVWSTVKNASLEGQRLLLVQPCHADGSPSGSPIICADGTGSAGAGELIYWCRGREASFAFLPQEVVTDNTIVAIVDEMHLAGPGGGQSGC
jgi:ethanolamine utilization protein EutN